MSSMVFSLKLRAISPVRPEPVEGHPAVLAKASTGSARTEIVFGA
jgi:hypothetical protein